MGKYKYLSTINSVLSTEPKDKMLDAYQSAVNDSFLLGTEWFSVQEENMDDLTYSEIKVRLNTIYSDSHSKLSDDYRKVIFEDFNHPRGLGTKFVFDDSTWLTINYDEYGKPTASVIIQKCRNVLKWVDQNSGAILTEPCVFDVTNDQRAKPIFNKFITVNDGYVGVAVQNNDNTAKIDMNQRFYFNGQCYKIWNIFNALNTPTLDGCPIIYFVVGKDQINAQLDDIANGIANYNDFDYTIAINQSGFDGIVGTTGTLTATVNLNGSPVTRDLTWSSSDTAVSTINKTTGAYSLVAIGTSNISVCLKDNPLVTASITVSVVDQIADNYRVIVEPTQNYILENDSLEYSVYRYNNDTKLDDEFTFSASGVDTSKYVFDAIDGNHFKVYNLQRSSNVLHVTCHDVTNTVDDTVVNISLKGVFYI